MSQYDSPRRSLPWDLLHPLTTHRTTEDDGPDCEPSSFVWPLDSDERVLVPFMLSLNEYNVLATTIDVGSDIAYGEDALRVTWLWLRNMRCPVDLCALIAQCIEDNPAITEIIAQQLIENETFNEWVETMIDTFAPEATGGNQYDAWPTAATPDPLCNAATYVVAKIRELIVGVYDDLETLTPQEVFEALLGLFGWRSGPLYQLIGLLETADRTALLAAYDAAAPDLICELIAAELDQEPIIAWIETTYPAPSVLGDAMKLAVQSAAAEGKYSQWIAVGATMTDATCDCEEPDPDAYIPEIGTWLDTPGGTLSGPDSEGYYIVTATWSGVDWRGAIQEATGKSFKLANVTYPSGGSACQVFERAADESVYAGCGFINQYANEGNPAINTILWTWDAQRSVRFQMIAP